MFPQASVNVQVLTCMKLFSQVPTVLVITNSPVTSPPQLSVAVSSSGTVISSTHWKVSDSGISGGIGASLSITVMVCVHTVTPPHSSVAVHSLVITVSQPPPTTDSTNSTNTSKPQPCDTASS